MFSWPNVGIHESRRHAPPVLPVGAYVCLTRSSQGLGMKMFEPCICSTMQPAKCHVHLCKPCKAQSLDTQPGPTAGSLAPGSSCRQARSAWQLADTSFGRPNSCTHPAGEVPAAGQHTRQQHSTGSQAAAAAGRAVASTARHPVCCSATVGHILIKP